MINNYKKYLKYKSKYNLLKGSGVNPYMFEIVKDGDDIRGAEGKIYFLNYISHNQLVLLKIMEFSNDDKIIENINYNTFLSEQSIIPPILFMLNEEQLNYYIKDLIYRTDNTNGFIFDKDKQYLGIIQELYDFNLSDFLIILKNPMTKMVEYIDDKSHEFFNNKEKVSSLVNHTKKNISEILNIIETQLAILLNFLLSQAIYCFDYKLKNSVVLITDSDVSIRLIDFGTSTCFNIGAVTRHLFDSNDIQQYDLFINFLYYLIFAVESKYILTDNYLFQTFFTMLKNYKKYTDEELIDLISKLFGKKFDPIYLYYFKNIVDFYQSMINKKIKELLFSNHIFILKEKLNQVLVTLIYNGLLIINKYDNNLSNLGIVAANIDLYIDNFNNFIYKLLKILWFDDKLSIPLEFLEEKTLLPPSYKPLESEEKTLLPPSYKPYYEPLATESNTNKQDKPKTKKDILGEFVKKNEYQRDIEKKSSPDILQSDFIPKAKLYSRKNNGYQPKAKLYPRPNNRYPPRWNNSTKPNENPYEQRLRIKYLSQENVIPPSSSS